MFRRTTLALTTLAWLLAATQAGAVQTTQKLKTAQPVAPAVSFERPDAQELLREAKALWHLESDFTGALAKFNAAVEAAPKDNDIRLQRGHFFEAVSTLVVPEDVAKFRERAMGDYQHIANSDPDSLVAGMARDGLARLNGQSFYEVKPVVCPTTAVEIHSRADSLYGARRFADAAAEYEKAAAGCPEASAWWVDFADSHYVLEDYARARELFVRALSIDPWNREAHRFLADAELQLRNGEAAVHQLVLAVVSDPSYESGWMALRLYATAMGRKWNRVYGNRKAEPRTADGALWVAYQNAKGRERGAQEGATSALAVERAAVRSALEAAHETEAGATSGPGPFWSMMSRADRAGFLDEAIFIHMLDSELAAEYPMFRENHAPRLAAYLETVIME